MQTHNEYPQCWLKCVLIYTLCLPKSWISFYRLILIKFLIDLKTMYLFTSMAVASDKYYNYLCYPFQYFIDKFNSVFLPGK